MCSIVRLSHSLALRIWLLAVIFQYIQFLNTAQHNVSLTVFVHCFINTKRLRISVATITIFKYSAVRVFCRREASVFGSSAFSGWSGRNTFELFRRRCCQLHREQSSSWARCSSWFVEILLGWLDGIRRFRSDRSESYSDELRIYRSIGENAVSNNDATTILILDRMYTSIACDSKIVPVIE